MTLQSLSQLLNQYPDLSNLALASLSLILSAVSIIWVSINNTRVRLVEARSRAEARRGAMKIAHEKMIRETNLRKAMWEAEIRRAETEFELTGSIESDAIDEADVRSVRATEEAHQKVEFPLELLRDRSTRPSAG